MSTQQSALNTTIVVILVVGLIPMRALAEPTLKERTSALAEQVVTLAGERGVQGLIPFEHPLDRAAQALDLMASSPTPSDTEGTWLSLQDLHAVVARMQTADRLGLKVPEDEVRQRLDTAFGLLDQLRDRVSGVSSIAAPLNFDVTDTCQTAFDFGFGTVSFSTALASQDGSSSCGNSSASADRWYRVGTSFDQTVIIEIVDADFDAVLSLHSDCPGTTLNELACENDTIGNRPRIERAISSSENIRIRVSGVDGAVGNFTLSIASKTGITSVVTDAITGAALDDAEVTLYSSSGIFLTRQPVDDNGFIRFQISPGNYFLSTTSPALDELFDDISCETECTVTEGTPVVVQTDQTSVANFQLTPRGAISGTVFSEDPDLDPVRGTVTALDSNGRFADQDLINADGSYRLGGLAPGNYRVETSSDHFDERWDDQPCDPSCLQNIGQTVTVVENQNTQNIDFVLAPKGLIHGTVRDSDNAPLHDVLMAVSNDQGDVLQSVRTQPDGTYLLRGLDTGQYRVQAVSNSYNSELWANIPCDPECDLQSGDLIAVTAGEVTSGIDFNLELGGVLSGFVRNRLTQDLLRFATIEVLDSFGNRSFVSSSGQEGEGWRMEGLPPGDYFALARPSGFTRQLFNGLDCPLGCDFLTATPITLGVSEIRSDIDFDLNPHGSMQGRVIRASDGQPVSSVVEVFRENGDLVTLIHATTGEFALWSLDAGTYFAKARDASFLLDQVFDGQTCKECDPLLGTPIVVEPGATTFGVDFSLVPCLDPEVQTLELTLFQDLHVVEACRTLAVGAGVTVGENAIVRFRAGESIVIGNGFSVLSGAVFKAEIDPELVPTP